LSRVRILALVAACLIATPALAEAPACKGRNVLDEMRTSDAAAFASIRSAADATVNARAILWKVEDPKQPQRAASYLFGTVHVTDARVLALSAATEQAMASVRRIALEVDDLSPQRVGTAMATVSDLILLPDHRRLATLLSDAEIRKVQGVMLDAGLSGEVASRVRPWVAQMLLAVSGCERRRVADGRLPLDASLQKRAETSGMSVVGLETIEMQFQSLAAVPEGDSVAVLKSGLKLLDRADDMLETLVQLYLRRDLGAIWPLQLAIAKKQGINPAAFTSFEKHLLIKRNVRMRDRVLSHLGFGGIFVAVGALHLPGKSGLVELLREAGYTVTQIE
jgi:uncharacterized protein